MDDKEFLRKWQECWYEIGLKSVNNLLSSIVYQVNDLRQDISKLSASGDQLKFFDYIYPSISKRLTDLEAGLGTIFTYEMQQKISKNIAKEIKKSMEKGKKKNDKSQGSDRE